MNQIRLISVIIATHNRCESLKDTLASILRQAVDGSFGHEVIVIDNNSNDQTRIVAQSFENEFRGCLKYLFEPRQGKAFALNRGLQEARGDIIAFTDDDCVLANDWLLQIYKAFLNPEVGLVQGKIEFAFEKPMPQWWGGSVEYQACEVLDKLPKEGLVKMCKEFESLDGANFSVSRKILAEIGNFNEALVRIEDTDFSMRAVNLGINIFYSYDIKVTHKVGMSKLTKSHWRKIAWLSGINSARIYDRDKIKHSFLGIPRWLLRGLAASLLRYLRFTASFDYKKSFSYEKLCIYKVGLMYSFLRDRFKLT